MTKEALKSAIEFAEYCLEELDLSHMASNQAKRLVQKSKEALAKPEQERCVGCEACIDTACGRDECPKGWPKALQPEQEPVAWRYKPAREDNPRWEYTTNHPLDMGDGYIRPSLVEYCKCIEPLYAKEKPKLMLEKFREMEDLLEEPAQQEPATKEKIREAIVFNLPLYTTPPQRKPLTDEEIGAILEGVNAYGTRLYTFARAIEAKLKEKNSA